MVILSLINDFKIAKGSISEPTATALAKSIVAISEAFQEHIESCINHQVIESVEEIKASINESDEYAEFKKYRFVKTENDAVSEDYESALKNHTYDERSIVYDYIYEMYKQAAFSKNNAGFGNSWSVQDSIAAWERKTAFAMMQKERMNASFRTHEKR